jgi:hypothetical protein
MLQARSDHAPRLLLGTIGTLPLPQDPTKLRYGCGVATAAQVNRVSSDLAALEPKVTAAAAQTSSLQATLVQGNNQTAALRAQVDELKTSIRVLTAAVQKLQANASSTAVPSTITVQLAALQAADTRTAQQLALLEAANQTAARDIAALKSTSQQCTCGLELSTVNTTLAAIKSTQTADAAAFSLANATVESLKAQVTTGAAAIASVNTSVAALVASVANVSTIDLSVYAKVTDLANINAVSLGGVPAAQYLRSRVVIYSESSTRRTASLGGRAGVDALCSASINRPTGLVQARAFVTTSSTDQIADFPTKYNVPSSLPIESLSGVVLANTYSNLGGALLTSLSSAGVLPPSTTWWSGSSTSGRFISIGCAEFNYVGGSGGTEVGTSSNTGSLWISSLNRAACTESHFILCIAF